MLNEQKHKQVIKRRNIERKGKEFTLIIFQIH